MCVAKGNQTRTFFSKLDVAAITDQPIERLAVVARRCAYAGVNTADAEVSTGAAARSLPFGGWISPFA